MQLTIYKNLNERIGKPFASATCVSFKKSGDKIDLDQVVCGEAIDGNSIWYKSKQGFYYWSGGIFETNFKAESCDLNQYSTSNKILIWKQLQKRAHTTFRNTVQGYIGCGFGYKNYDTNEDISLIVYVDQKISLTNPILNYKICPKIQFWGFEIKTDVMSLSIAEHHYDQDVANARRNLELDAPLLIGGGIEDGNQKWAGTRSLIVSRKNDQGNLESFLLGSYHVMLHDYITISKDFQGSPFSSSIFPIINSNPTHKIIEGCYNNDFDYVAIRVESNNSLVNEIDNAPVKEYFEFDELHDLLGKTLLTAGYYSGLQRGKVLSLFNNPTLAPHNQQFDNVIFTEKISIQGDSGAPVIEESSKKLVGFIIGGNEVDTSFILPYYNLKHHKDFEII